MIEILSSGQPNVVQDLGRLNHLSLGVSRAGALDTLSLSLANLALTNPPGAAGLEISLFPFRLRFLQDTAFSCTGAPCPLSLDGVALPPWWCATARAGQVLRLDTPGVGARAYLAFLGGIAVPEVLGARATDLKTGFGGLHGRGLRRGDRLPLGSPAVSTRIGFGLWLPEIDACWHELKAGELTLGVIPAAEYLAFDVATRQTFAGSTYRITADASRQGYRLKGPALKTTSPLELMSHGIVPGTLQVPPSGQPIIQLAEANTCGGYPKIATVLPTELWKLGQASPGVALRFVPVALADAVAALKQRQDLLQRVSAQVPIAPRHSRPSSSPFTHEEQIS